MLFKWSLSIFGVCARITIQSIKLGAEPFNGFIRDAKVTPVMSAKLGGLIPM